MQFQCSYGGPYGLKEQRNVFMGMKCFCLQYYLNIRHPLPVLAFNSVTLQEACWASLSEDLYVATRSSVDIPSDFTK